MRICIYLQVHARILFGKDNRSDMRHYFDQLVQVENSKLIVEDDIHLVYVLLFPFLSDTCLKFQLIIILYLFSILYRRNPIE